MAKWKTGVDKTGMCEQDKEAGKGDRNGDFSGEEIVRGRPFTSSFCPHSTCVNLSIAHCGQVQLCIVQSGDWSCDHTSDLLVFI